MKKKQREGRKKLLNYYSEWLSSIASNNFLYDSLKPKYIKLLVFFLEDVHNCWKSGCGKNLVIQYEIQFRGSDLVYCKGFNKAIYYDKGLFLCVW